MKILALDQAIQTTGYAIFDENKLITSGTFTIQASLPIERRLGEIWNHLNNLYHDYEFAGLAFEDTQLQYGNVETFRKLCYVESAIMLWCYFNDIKYKVYSPSSWRAIIGKGWGKKREEQKAHAIELVKQMYSVDVDSDSADAIMIGTAYIKDRSGSAF